MVDCRTCELVRDRDSGDAPPWDLVLRTPGWDVAHAFGTSIEGWMVLVARRHITAVADLTDHEALELGPLIRDVSAALHATISCPKTYVAQFAEHPQHRHVHVHVIPRAHDLPPDQHGPGVFSQVGVPDEHCVSAARMNQIASDVGRFLGTRGGRR